MSQSDPNTEPPPSFFRLLGAILYDALAIAAIWFFAALIIVILRQGEAVSPGNIFFLGYLLMVSFAYFGFCWTRSGQTLGMRSWKIRLVDSKTRQLVGWACAAKRCAAATLSLGVLGLGFIWMIFDHDSRTVHDRISGSHIQKQ
ncbi:MAG TPA: RDD family protein [Gammaproteobacteria bacterium]|nr:RDD family protein [Gammaproteobacteria bacterium]